MSLEIGWPQFHLGLGIASQRKDGGWASRRFNGKVALITGAGSGIATAAARLFASEGACGAIVK